MIYNRRIICSSILFALFILSGSLCFAQTFTTSDLSGTWYVFGVSSGGNYAGTSKGTMVLNSSGSITGGSYTTSAGTSASITGGSFAINSNGVIQGAAYTNIGITISSTSGKINSSKDVISLVDSTNAGEYDLLVLIKAGGTFTASDLSGTWYVFGVSSGGNYAGTSKGTMVLNSSGSITGGSYTTS
ncbi:MAG: hypothetical protein ABSE05_06245, partial [Syntrophales bacterium]